MATKTMQRAEIGAYMKRLRDEFSRQLEQLGPAFKKKTRGNLEAGFADGVRSMFLSLEADGYLDVDRSGAHAILTIAPYRVSHVAPCGATVVSGNPDTVTPSAELLERVTCADCRSAIRNIAVKYDRARRRGEITKTWGQS